jgi:hypothetical protein
LLRRRRLRRLVRGGFIVGFGVGFTLFGGLPALATDYPSGWLNYGPVNGINYQNRSTFNTIILARLEVQVTGGVGGMGTLPAGWMGSQPKLYLNGAVCRQTGMTYTPVAENYQSIVTGYGTCGHGNYYAKGVSTAYNGNGYSSYSANQTPIWQGG